MDGSKVPKLDGMLALFYQHFWEIVDSDLVQMVVSFLNRGHLSRELCLADMVLVPKVE